ncbi:Hypothetical predicted protein [Xyrichtys novacula]|uniref:Uncharacterized protein n=1 Tax=Xyrichtys novacula TaxID=13765 RepID=A0AAV1G0W4_XYRNO|nr:Hypothetical predicted protein [Xyrichtys novacula]
MGGFGTAYRGPVKPWYPTGADFWGRTYPIIIENDDDFQVAKVSKQQQRKRKSVGETSQSSKRHPLIDDVDAVVHQTDTRGLHPAPDALPEKESGRAADPTL